MSRSRAEYNFPSSLKKERREGVNRTCEHPGCEQKAIEVHHLLAAFLCAHNPILAPHIIKVCENAIVLCRHHHDEYNAQQETWTPEEIGWQAWGVLGLDPFEVAEAQTMTYLDREAKQYSRKKKKRKSKRKHRRRRSRKSRRR